MGHLRSAAVVAKMKMLESHEDMRAASCALPLEMC
tara:strand:- start:137 stop:241 length:105 start_codon:yes stop_codon:yes gene_type:complete